MAGSADHDLDSGATQPLHVLVADEDAADLRRTALCLLEAGYVVSVHRGAGALFEAIARLQPDLILLDPLMVGLEFEELTRRYRAAEGPRIALHSKVLPQVLHGAISFKDVVGVLHKSDDEQAFRGAFQALTKTLLPRQGRGFRSDSPPAISGTHLIGASHALPFEPRVRRG
ncbi:MAG: hypothetical protein ABUL62_09365 [Myxococcales bacterium]